jgi:tetratricopeptide (TPR) repeat protein
LPIGKKSLFLLRAKFVETRQLVDLLHHYTGSSSQEAAEVISMRNEYPYSQVLQALSARVSKDHNYDNQQLLLQSAAVYSTDRTVLKEIMSKVYEAAYAKEVVPEVAAPLTVSKSSTIQKTIDSIDYADEVIHDLERLNELKLNFEALAAGFGYATSEAEIEKPKMKPPGRPKKNVEVSSDPLIEDIKTSKKKIDPESPKTIEQIAIIDQFIKAQPTIKPKSVPTQQSDLAEVKSGEFTDNIVSETLAEILVRQGKKDKAIEVYRKLIWKFPQKKAYFAAQIEELKK